MDRRDFLRTSALALVALPLATTSSRAKPTRDAVFNVPTSIDRTGSSDVTGALFSWIASVPNGTSTKRSILQFNGGTYRIDGQLSLASRSFLTFDLNSNTTFKWNAPQNDGLRLLLLSNCASMIIRKGALTGTYVYPTSGSGLVDALQHMHAIDVDRSSVDVTSMHISGFYGDGIDYTNEAGTSVASSGTVSGCDIRQVGRNAVSCVCADGVIINGNHIQQTGYWGVDVEPNAGQSAPCRNVQVTSNTWGTQGGTTSRRWFGIAPNAAVSGVTVTGNQILSRDPSVWINYNGNGVLSTTFRPQNVSFSNNTCDTVAAELYPIRVFNTDTLSGNGDQITPASGGAIFGLTAVTGFTGSDSHAVI
jgi:hypothetical protein